MTELKTLKDLGIEEELCYRLDVDVYLPVKEKISGISERKRIAIPHSLGIRKEGYKRTIEYELGKLRRELAIPWIKELDRQRHEMFKQPNKTFDRAMIEGKRELLREIFNITKEDLK